MAEAAQPKVSIIIPTLNAGALLDNCLASVASQTYPRHRIEIILADAFSKDATRDIAKRYGAIVLDDTGIGVEIFVPKEEGIDPDLIAMCRMYAYTAPLEDAP